MRLRLIQWAERLLDYRLGRVSLCYIEPSGVAQYDIFGVLCDMYAKEHNIPWYFRGSIGYFLGENGWLPEEVLRWSGLTREEEEMLGNRWYWGRNGSVYEIKRTLRGLGAKMVYRDIAVA